MVYIGQSIPNGVTTYLTPSLVRTALKQALGETTDAPLFLKHTLNNNIVTESYLGFVITDEMVTENRNAYIENCNNDQQCIDNYHGMTAGTYYLKGRKTYEYINNSGHCIAEFEDEGGNCISPDYEANKEILLSAFGNYNCGEFYSLFDCMGGGLYIRAHFADSVDADFGWSCGVNAGGEAACYG